MPDSQDYLNKYYIEDSIYTLTNRIPDNTLNLVLTSPPYDNIRSYSNNYCFDFETIAKLLAQKLAVGGVIVWVVSDASIKGSETGTSFRQALYFKDNCGLRLHDTMLYMKNTSAHPARRDGKRYSQIFEYMFVFSKDVPKTANLICDRKNKWVGTNNWGDRKDRIVGNNDTFLIKKKPKAIHEFSPRTNAWKYIVGKGHSGTDDMAYEHPAIFPEPLARDHIITWTNPGDIVYDPFVGSGTTLKMAKELGRNYIGSEINSEYENLINRRLELI